MRLNPNLRSRIDAEEALQDIRERDYMQERLARLNRMDTDYSRFYTPRSRWKTLWQNLREVLLFVGWLVKWTVIVAIALVALYGVVTVVRQIVSGRM